MKKILFLVAIVVAVAVPMVSAAREFNIPYCYEVKNEHYDGPCVAFVVDGVITGDETTTK